MADRSPAIRVDGLREFRAALKTADAQSTKIINEELRVAAAEVAQTARGLAPRRTGRLAESLRPFAAGNRVGVRSRLPYAGVVHWGGTISPRGTDIRFRRTEFITRAVERHEAEIVRDLGEALERALVRIAND